MGQGREVREVPEEEKPQKKVKVIDRRWFTPEGELRPDLPELPPKPPENPPAPELPKATEVPKQPPRGPQVRPPQGLTFYDLVDFFAQQVVALLSGQLPGRGRDLDTARYLIDLLAVVQEKTAGKLTAEEARYLEDVLFQLRSVYVSVAR